VSEPSSPADAALRHNGLWNARSPRIPYIDPADLTREGPAAAAPRRVLEFESGQRVTVSGEGLMGRAPSDPDDRGLQLVRVDDPERSVSKVHAWFHLDDDDELWIEDLDSGNGTAIVEPGRPPQSLVPGRRYPVPPGAVVRIGRQSFVAR
jgi:hypothetical protein